MGASSIDTKSALIAGGVGAAVTYYLTKRHFDSKTIQLRKEKYERDQKERSAENATRQGSDLPNGVELEGVQSDAVYLQDLEHLGKYFASEGEGIANVMANPMGCEYNKLIGPRECILANIRRGPGKSTVTRAFLRAGPRKELHFNPKTVNAAIVTCGGLCPGLNNVIREITRSLFYLYGIQGKCYGIVGGYSGFYDPKTPPIELTPDTVQHIHNQGGTMLGSSRGGFDIDKIVDFIKKKNIRQLYVIGGDGTHRGAFKIHETCMELGLHVAVAGIPKTIDNDVDYIDRSFGFITSVEEAQAAIRAAKTEAMCNLPNGIGIVKLMGRSSGYIAAQ
jgi:6-phosphofructokinase 1